MRKLSLFLIAIALITFSSCQKEVDNQFDNNGANPGGGGTPNTASIIGDYDFNGIGANIETTVTASAMGQEIKAVTTSDYVSENNVGTAKITSSQMIFTGMGYEIDTVVHLVTYLNGAVFEETEQDFEESFAPANDTLNYVKISEDSISITSGSLIPTGASPVSTGGPIGAKLAWSGDTLLVKFNSTFSTIINQGGIPGELKGSMNGVIKLKKR